MNQERKKVPSELTADVERLISVLTGTNPSKEWRGIIKSARKAGVLGSPNIPDCIEAIKAERAASRAA